MKKTCISNRFLQALLFLMFFCFARNAFALFPSSIVGTWRLLSAVDVDQQSGKKMYRYGKHPEGYLIYQPDGYMSVMIVDPDQQKKCEMQSHSAQSSIWFSSMISYAGTYTVTDQSIIHHIEIAWKPSWVNTNQKRDYILKGNKLILSINEETNKKSRSVLVWEKV